jgi:hypothetical protein
MDTRSPISFTHVDDGFVFLGHRIIRKRGSNGRMSVVTTIPKEGLGKSVSWRAAMMLDVGFDMSQTGTAERARTRIAKSCRGQNSLGAWRGRSRYPQTGHLLLSGFDSKPARWRAGSGTNRSSSICVSSSMMHATPIRPVGQGEPRANSGGSGVECGGRVPVMRFVGEIDPSARFHPHRFSRPDITGAMIRFYQINQYVIP